MKISINQRKNVRLLTFLSVILFATILFGGHSVFGASLVWEKNIDGWVDRKNLALGHDGTIYVPVTSHYALEPLKLYAFHRNGTLRWTFNTARKVNGTPSIAPDGTIYMGSRDAALYAIQPDGQELWNCPVQGNTIQSPAIGTDRTIYIGSRGINYEGGFLNAVNPDGSIKWSYQFPPDCKPDHSPVIGVDGTIYIMVFMERGHVLHSFSPNMVLKWKSPSVLCVNTYQPSIGACGTIYVPSDERLWAFHPADGHLKWSQPIPSYHSSVAIGVDGTLYIGSKNKKMYALNPRDGSVKWTRNAEHLVTSGPIVTADRSIIFGSMDKKLYSIYPSGALVKWTYDTNETLEACPVITGDGTIYEATYNGTNNYFFAIKDNNGGTAKESPWCKAGGNNFNTGNNVGYFPNLLYPQHYALLHPTTINSISFDWEDFPLATKYSFQISSTPGFENAETVSLTSSNFVKGTQNMENGREYFWRVAVKAPNVEETYGPSHSFFYGLPLVRAFVLAPTYGATVPNPVYMSWRYPGAVKYYVEIATDSNFTQLVGNGWVNGEEGFLPLPPKTTYYMRVAPADADNIFLVNNWSYTYKFTTAP